MNGHKAEAEKALETVIAALAGKEPLDGLRRFQLKAAVEYAMEQVGAIQELKRARKSAEEGPGRAS